MATDKFSPNDISDLNQDWGIDNTDISLRPFSGRAVQKFIKEQLIDLKDNKFGHVTYEGGSLVFYDEDNGTIISTLQLSGTIYTLSLDSNNPLTFTALINDTSKFLTVIPSSKEGSIGEEMSDFFESYQWVMSVDTGNRFKNVTTGSCLSGSSFSVDIRPYLSIGLNRIRFSVTGDDSQQTKSIVFSCTLTSLTLSCNHDWNNAWIEGENYYIKNIFFSGNMQKVLNVRIDNDNSKIYTQTFSATTNYLTTPYQFNLTNYFPLTTGIHTVDIWISGSGVTTQHYVYDIMCVRTVDIFTAKLICINEVTSPIVNFENQILFKYAVYNTQEVVFNITSNDSEYEYPIVVDQVIATTSEEKISYSIRLEVPTESVDGVSLTISALADVIPEVKTVNVDNSKAFAAVSDAYFYMNTSLRSNNTSDRETIINNAPNASIYEYPASWNNFSWSKDGWSEDSELIKCLVVQAGSTVECQTIKPLSVLAEGKSLTLEFKLKVDNVADYNTPIMSFMGDTVYDENTTNGIIIFPTRIEILNTLNRNHVQQSVNFEEGQQLHFVIVFQKRYATTGRNLCRIYINGVQQCVFEYDGSANFNSGYLRMGQASSDLYLYMLRYYNNVAFEADAVLKNWLNALTETAYYSREGLRADNDIYDGASISYALVKNAGFNTMVIEVEGDAPIPSLTNTSARKSNLTVEYNDHPEWNFRITDAPIDGQGTTSMRYYRWNLRWKLAKADPVKGTPASVWQYADNSTSTTKGWFDGINNHVKVGRITAKKNIASSSQGHKMGATAMYHELYAQLGLNHDLPTGARVSVFQYPVIGFQKYSDGSYQFIGLYTIGPDKGDKDTFGYNTTTYPDMLSIEGPNHAPLGTRFLHPWVNVTYSSVEEVLKFGGEEGWSISAWNDVKYGNEADILSLYEAEWKPAYELVYYCSSYLKSLAETGFTLEQINADITTFRNATNLLGVRKNEVVTLYDSNYNLIYYSNYTKQYEILTGHNVKDYLVGYLINTVNPTTEELITARRAKFFAEVGNYFDIESLLYHENFLLLIGASDNHAKNLYPFKLKSLAEGGRWQFRQDDLDTILATDNNGNSTKSYFVEPGDLTPNGTDIYQGSSSVLWTLLRETFQVRLRAMMIDMVNGLVSLASYKGVTKSYMWETVLAMFDFYFWRNSAKYFPVRVYSEDATFGYIYVWALSPATSYNNVYPLTQALGTQLEAEQQWALRRILYIFSKYEIGGFNGSVSDGLGSIEFTPGQAFTFNLKPAINLYPSGNLGGGTNIRGARTASGEVCQIASSSDGTTTYYLKSLDWLTSLGDLSSLVLTSRGGVSTIPFSVKSKRLRTLKVGDAIAENVLFNATSLTVESESLEELDVRNVVSIDSTVDLSNCPRLKAAKFEGSSVPTIVLPIGSKIMNISFPSTVRNIYLNKLPFLNNNNLVIPNEALSGIRGLYINDCPNINMFDILRDISSSVGSDLRFITIIIGTVTGIATDLTMLARFVEPYNADTDSGFGRIEYDSTNKIYSFTGGKPNIQGTINIPAYAYRRDVDSLRNYFNSLIINVLDYYVHFEDEAVKAIIATNFGDGTGITEEQVATITTLGTIFKSNTTITKFNELENFINVGIADFENCTNLSSVKLPAKTTIRYNFKNSGLTSIDIPEGVVNCTGTFYLSSKLVEVTIPTTLRTVDIVYWMTGCPINIVNIKDVNSYLKINWGIFGGDQPSNPLVHRSGATIYLNGDVITTIVVPNDITTIYVSAFAGFKELISLILHNGIASIGEGAFLRCSSLTSLALPTSISMLKSSTFNGCTSLRYITLPKPTLITLNHTNAFTGTTNLIVVGQGVDYATDKALYDQYVAATNWSTLKTRLRTNFGVFNGTPLALDTSAAAIYANLYGLDIDGDGVKTLSDETLTEVAKFVTNLGSVLQGTTISGSQSLTSLGLDKFTNLTTIANLFMNCPNLTSLDLSNWDLSKCTNLGLNNVQFGVFASYNTYSPIINLNVSGLILNTNDSITRFNLFMGLDKVTSLDVSTLNTSKVTSLLGAFYNCKSLISLDVSTWDTSKVTEFSSGGGYGSFVNCNSLTSLDLRSWSTESSLDADVGYSDRFLYGCTSLTSFRVSYKFFLAPSLQINYLVGLTAWVDVTQITEMLNALPDATGNPTRTLMLSTNTKAVVIANNLGSIASTKNWTIV